MIKKSGSIPAFIVELLGFGVNVLIVWGLSAIFKMPFYDACALYSLVVATSAALKARGFI